MTKTIQFFIPGDPVAKLRHRSVTRIVAKRVIVRNYTPAKTVAFEQAVGLIAKVAAGAGWKPVDGVVHLSLDFGMRVPASWSNKKRDAALRGEIAPTAKPDLTNLAKSIEDGMNHVIYLDDSQITQMTIAKRYAANPGVAVLITVFE